MNVLRKISPRMKKILRVVVVCFTLLCALVEGLGHVPGSSFNGWTDVFSWADLPQPHVISEGELQVHFLDVGNADCILVRQNDHNMLIDTGETPQEKLVMEYLERHKISKLDLVISTHPHVDHMGMMDKLIRRIPIERFVMSYMPEGQEPTNSAYVLMLEALKERKVSVEEAEVGAIYDLGTAKVQILAPHPLKEPIEDENQISVVSRLTFGQHSFLFTGDAEVDLEERMVASGLDLSADVLKVAHHGSKTSTSPAFLRAVSPKYAVISCGENDYGHPNDEVVRRLAETDARIYRTDIHGDIVFTSDGQKLSLTYSKED